MDEHFILIPKQKKPPSVIHIGEKQTTNGGCMTYDFRFTMMGIQP